MRETKKSIIDLIEPYMNKTLSEWCLILQWLVYLKYILDKRENWLWIQDWKYEKYYIKNWELNKILDRILTLTK
jgi:hypothetical protein